MGTRKTLEERLAKRNHRERCSLMPHVHVRAELDRLARQVRKLYPESGATRCVEEALGNAARNKTINDVLRLIREAKQ